VSLQRETEKMKYPKWLIALVVFLLVFTTLCCSVEVQKGAILIIAALGLVFGIIGTVRWFKELWT
jgi:hypothetical protein